MNLEYQKNVQKNNETRSGRQLSKSKNAKMMKKSGRHKILPKITKSCHDTHEFNQLLSAVPG